MLALDKSIGCIEATGTDVLDLFSAAPVVLERRSGSGRISHEAYVCAVRRQSGVKVYVALLAADKKVFVYTTKGEPEPEKEYHRTLEVALEFAKGLGFCPERVNLNYSPAMREVVLRNIKILRPTGSKVQALPRHGAADAPTAQHHKKGARAASAVAGSELGELPLCLDDPAPGAEPPAPAAAAPPIPVPVALPVPVPVPVADTVDVADIATAAAPPPPEPVPLAAVLTPPPAPAREEPSALQGELARVADQYQEFQRQTAQQLARLQEKVQGAEQERDRARQEAAQLRQELNETSRAEANRSTSEKLELRAQSEKFSEVAAQLAELNAAHEELSARHTRLEGEYREQSARLATAQQELAEKSAAHETVSRQLRDSEAQCQEQAAGLAAAEQELLKQAKLQGKAAKDRFKLEKKREQAVSEAGALREEVGRLTEARDQAVAAQCELAAECARLKESQETLQQQLAEKERGSAGATELERQLERLLAERQRQGAELTSLETALNLALRERSHYEQENATLIRELAALGARLSAPAAAPADLSDTSLPEAGGAPEAGTRGDGTPEVEPPPLGMWQEGDETQACQFPEFPELPQQWEAPVGEASSEEHGPLPHRHSSVAADWYQWSGGSQESIEISAADDDFFPAGDDTSDGCGMFLLKPGAGPLSYRKPEDVLEFYRSVNVASLSPEGKAPVVCQGYIFAVGSERQLQVAVALHAATCGRFWLYLPERQPEHAEELSQAISAALTFAESVGLLMEQVPAPDRAATLAQSPVLVCGSR